MEVRCAGDRISLGTDTFVAEGGQARVYTRNGWAYKVFLDPTAVPDPRKLAALRVLDGPGVVAPADAVFDPQGQRVGYRMRFLDGWGPLARLFAPAYQQRHGLEDRVGAWVRRLRAEVRRAHDHGALIVDLNALNVLVDPHHDRLALIDVDSWQIAGFPASALAETVRDRHNPTFSEQTDWFAFAIVTFQLFAGIHPYRGRHPRVSTLDARMRDNLSVFHPDVRVPPMVDLTRIPPAWRDFYEAHFVYGERPTPPDGTIRVRPLRAAVLPGNLDVQVHVEAHSPIRGLASWDGRTWWWTADGLFENARRLGPPPPAGAVPFRSPDGIAFASGSPVRVRLPSGESLETSVFADRLTGHAGMLHGISGDALVELELRVLGGRPTLTPRTASHLAPHATRLFRGVAATSLFGSLWITELGAGSARQRRLEGLDGLDVVDGIHDGGVTVLITRASSGWMRHIVLGDQILSESASLPSAELIVLPTGIAMVPTDDGVVLLHPDHPELGTRRAQVDLPGPLAIVSGRPGFFSDNKAFTVALRR